MAKGEFLGEFEQIVLMALLHLRDNAYGMLVRQEIEARTGRAVSIGAVYATLSRLEEKGYIKSKLSEPTAQRGGKAKRYFEISGSGVAALRHSQLALQQMMNGLPSHLLA
jgi:DNA-binding PadR family transcriptional regulator